MKQFIKEYNNMLSHDSCDYIIKLMTDHDDLTNEGTTSYGVDKRFKVSKDLNLTELRDTDENLEFTVIPEIQHAIGQGLIKYNREHPIIPGGKALDKFTDSELTVQLQNQTIMDNSILSMRYPKGEGFFDWHIDNADGWKGNARILVLMFYLNDIEEGGETEFDYQDIVVKPKKGTLVIFPTDWTHLHRGKMPISNDKYILNCWLLRKNPVILDILDKENNI